MRSLRMAIMLLLALGICVELAAVSVAWFGVRTSGMAWDSIAVEKDGRFYETGRGGGPIEKRHLREVTPQQYATRKKHEEASLVIAILGGALLAASLGCAIAHSIAKRRDAQ